MAAACKDCTDADEDDDSDEGDESMHIVMLMKGMGEEVLLVVVIPFRRI